MNGKYVYTYEELFKEFSKGAEPGTYAIQLPIGASRIITYARLYEHINPTKPVTKRRKLPKELQRGWVQ